MIPLAIWITSIVAALISDGVSSSRAKDVLDKTELCLGIVPASKIMGSMLECISYDPYDADNWGEVLEDNWDSILLDMLSRSGLKPEDPVLYLGVLELDPEYQRHGYGRRILEQIMIEGAKQGAVAIVLYATSIGIQEDPRPFYEKLGFEEIVDRPYGSVMVYHLPRPAALTTPPTIAYHCGRDVRDGFSLSFLGSGEGMLALGPGVYFATDEDIARRYCKYVDDPYIYRVSIPSEGLYDFVRGLPVDLRDRVIVLKEEVQAEGGGRRLRDGNRFKHGPGTVGQITRALGQQEAFKRFKEIGLTGLVENIGSGKEICVYDPSIIHIMSKERGS